MRQAFVVHPGIKWALTGYNAEKKAQSNANRILYDRFEAELATRAMTLSSPPPDHVFVSGANAVGFLTI